MYTPICMDVSSGLLESDSEITVGGRDRGTEGRIPTRKLMRRGSGYIRGEKLENQLRITGTNFKMWVRNLCISVVRTILTTFQYYRKV
jgi:hypothetical protein